MSAEAWAALCVRVKAIRGRCLPPMKLRDANGVSLQIDHHKDGKVFFVYGGAKVKMELDRFCNLLAAKGVTDDVAEGASKLQDMFKRAGWDA